MMTLRSFELENLMMFDQKDKNLAAMHSKMAKQSNEIARLLQALEKVTREKLELLEEINWIRGGGK